MKGKRITVIAWVFFGLIAISVTVSVIYIFTSRPIREHPALPELLFPLVPVAFAFVGALIISRQSQNVIGKLMMLPGLSFFFLVDVYLQPFISGAIPLPQSPSPLFLLIVWYSNWNWLVLVFPIVFIILLFPTGQPPIPRWRWLIYFGLALFLAFVMIGIFVQQMSPGATELEWIQNPIGFIPNEWLNTYIVGPWLMAFPLWVLLCAVSLLVRFRSTKGIEREQIKWLFYAGGLFAAIYVPTFIGDTYSQTENIWNILLAIGMLAIPAAIAIAILRYRLYDIDIIIRRTLQYALLTGLLVLFYFGSVVLLQTLVENLTGEQSPLVIVLSTLAIAALFNPLRLRVQDFIDQRFYRKKYDDQQTLAQFAAAAWDEVDMDKITATMLRVIEETIQPEQVSLQLKKFE
jgi:hypothetical protein